MRGRVEEKEAGRGGERGGATGKEKDKGRVGGRKREKELDLQISSSWCIYIPLLWPLWFRQMKH